MSHDFKGYFVTGTDTDVGKTVAAAWCMLHLGAAYWKPTQSGLEPPTDTDKVRDYTQCAKGNFYPETYRLTQPLSPHEAAKRDGIEIDMDQLKMPQTIRPLIVEGAGGLMVPLNNENYVIDLIKKLGLPAILVVRSGLGTINHTLLSLEAMRARNIPIAGVIMNGEKSSHNRQAIEEFGKVSIITEIPLLESINKESLLAIKPEIDLNPKAIAA